jgi:translation initiation factor 3 subunit H
MAANSYSRQILDLRPNTAPDSPVGVYLSTHSGGYVTKAVIEMLTNIEKSVGRGRAILVIHDAARSVAGELSVKGYRLSDGGREAAKKGQWTAMSLVSISYRLTSG